MLKFDSITEVVEFLRKLKRSDFSSDLHYIYYVRYIKSKLSSINREYAVKAFGREIKKKSRVQIYVSPRYIVIRFVVGTKRGGDWFIQRHLHTYVLGINDDFKLFVNRVDMVPVGARIVSVDEYGNELYTVPDDKVYQIFEFNHNAVQEEVVISGRGSYRVQGEIVIDAMGALCDLHWTIKRSIEVESYITRLYTNIIALLLRQRGFHVEVEEECVTMPLSVKRNVSNAKLKIIKRAIKRELGNPIVVNGFMFYYDIYPAVRCRSGNQYCDLQLNVHPHCTNKSNDMCSYILDQIHAAIEELKKTNFKHIFGNHTIELRNVYSLSVIIEPQIPDVIKDLAEMVRPLEAIEIYTDGYCVDQDTEVVVSHHEHGITRVRFSGPFIIRLRTTTVNERFPSELNRVMLSKLISKLMKQAEEET